MVHHLSRAVAISRNDLGAISPVEHRDRPVITQACEFQTLECLLEGFVTDSYVFLATGFKEQDGFSLSRKDFPLNEIKTTIVYNLLENKSRH